jgi:hypothetical protein
LVLAIGPLTVRPKTHALIINETRLAISDGSRKDLITDFVRALTARNAVKRSKTLCCFGSIKVRGSFIHGVHNPLEISSNLIRKGFNALLDSPREALTRNKELALCFDHTLQNVIKFDRVTTTRSRGRINSPNSTINRAFNRLYFSAAGEEQERSYGHSKEGLHVCVNESI